MSHDLSIRVSVSKKYRMTDNVASMESVAKCSEELQSFFEVCSLPQSVEQVNSGNEIDSLGLTDELPTDFSREAKSLKPEINSQDSLPLWTKDEVAQKLRNFSKQDLEFLLKFDFSETDLIDDEFALLARILVEDQDVYSQFQYDVGQIKQQVSVKLKPGSELKTQRPSEVPIHYRDKLEALLEQLE